MGMPKKLLVGMDFGHIRSQEVVMKMKQGTILLDVKSNTQNLGLKAWRWVFLYLSLFLAVGCSDIEFRKRPAQKIDQRVNAKMVDILFVVDNSGSMYVEQTKMAQAFPDLVNGLKINNLNYRIGITTTDVISRNNPRKALAGLAPGALQHGRLIKFQDGNIFLDKYSKDIESQFRKTIQRKETLDCEKKNFKESLCPSGDERGIYAATLAVKRNEKRFFRPGSHISVVFLTDEDERGTGFNNTRYRPQTGDYPSTLVKSIYNDLGPSHTMSFHSVVVLNSVCKQSQLYQVGNEFIYAHIGTFYKQLTYPDNTSWLLGGKLKDLASGKMLQGTQGSICAPNYTRQVGSILGMLVQHLSHHTPRVDLNCRPDKGSFRFKSCPAGVTCHLSHNKRFVTFTPPLSPDQEVEMEYMCP